MIARSHGELRRFMVHDQFAVAATNHSALGSDKMRSVEVRSGLIR